MRFAKPGSTRTTPPESPILPGDNPQAYIPGDRRRALARGEDLPRTTDGAAIFVDISGFTALTEALVEELGGRRGAEELTATLDRLFSALLERLHAWRGSVVYFSGDAVTGWIDGDDGLNATACALEMQRLVDRIGTMTTAGGRQVVLSIKVAVAVGRVHRFVVGDPSVQLIDVMAGRLMDALAAAEQQALAGEVVLEAGAMTALGKRVTVALTRSGSKGAVGVVQRLNIEVGDLRTKPPTPDLPIETVRRWLLPPVWERIAAGRGEFLAELRPAVPLFVQVGGLDFENEPGTPEVLGEFVTRCQRALGSLGGYVLQLTVGDKGVYLYAVFGSPIAHEDDHSRACEGALRLGQVLADLPVSDVRIGVASGLVRSGTYGHAQRRTFCCLGDPVNLAARLMARAPAGGVLVDGETAAAAGNHFRWAEIAPMTVKGKQQPIAVRSLLGHAQTAYSMAPQLHQERGAMVGRAEELTLLRGLWRRATDGAGQVAFIQSEPGIGKSRLVGELVGGLVAAGHQVAWGEAAPVTADSPYFALRGIWASLLELDLDAASGAAVAAAVATLDASLEIRAPLLAAVLGVGPPDNELTGGLARESRKASLENLLAQIAAIRAQSSPVAIVVEDCHWLDDSSRDVLGVLARGARRAPVFLVLTSRPDGTPMAGLPLGQGNHVREVQLGALPPSAAEELVITRHLLLTGARPSAAILSEITRRAEGNPFFMVQLVDYLGARLSGSPPAATDGIDLPDSMHSLVLSRIDGQPEGPRRAVKVASVVGRTFPSALVAEAYPDLGPPASVDEDLVAFATTRLIDLEDAADRRFAFAHSVTRDVAYDSLPFGVRSMLHGRVAETLESQMDGPIRHLDLLAFHYARSNDLQKRRRYLLAAADAAQAAYANVAAANYLELVLPQVEPHERGGILLRLADAKELSGDWSGAETAAQQAMEAANEVGDLGTHARALVARSELARKQGRYAEAEELLASAALEFGAASDESGQARVLHLRGTLLSQQGDAAGARAAYQSSLSLREALGDDAGVAATLTNLALVAEDEGDLDAAERIGQDALARRRGLGDRRAIGVSLTNMGMLATARGDLTAARTRFTEAEELAEEVGDPWLVAVARHNLGNVTRDMGDSAIAATNLQEAMATYFEYDDRWSLAHVFEDVALWLLSSGSAHDADAMTLLVAAQRVREEIGAPRFPPTEAQLEAALEPARARTAAALLQRAASAGAVAEIGNVFARADELLGLEEASG